MTVRVYRSSDSGAPVLTGQAGSLLAVLNGCLVDGYGSQTASGWAKEFTTTNIVVYRAPSGLRFRLRVDDTGTNEARVVGYESMSGVNTGTGDFPTAAQQSGGLYIRKSETTDSTARGWVVVATDKAFYFLPQPNNGDWLVPPVTTYLSGQFFFGDFESFKVSDSYSVMIIGASTSNTGGCRLGTNSPTTGSFSALPGHYVARDYTGGGTSKQAMKRAMYDLTGRTPFGHSSNAAFPDVVTTEMLVSPIAVIDSDGAGPVYRGILPGLWAPLHASPGSHGDTIAGSGTTSGKNFQLFNTADTSTIGRALIEISNTW